MYNSFGQIFFYILEKTESFGSVDGPGVRFLIFLQGCAMRCRYCHNADTWRVGVGTEMTADELLDRAERYRSYWGTEGGITVSGGEPLLQIEFLTELFREAKRRGIHTCVDTAGQPFSREEPLFSRFRELLRYTDLLLVDIKHIDCAAHQKLTGHKNDNILDMLRFLSDEQKPVWIRHVLVPVQNVQKIEVLPYHAMGAYKWKELGLAYTLENTQPPTPERVRNAERILGIR